MAGILALIGEAFGILCGKNGDLTYDGAARWESMIPMQKEEEVYFYTTQVGYLYLVFHGILKYSKIMALPLIAKFNPHYIAISTLLLKHPGC